MLTLETATIRELDEAIEANFVTHVAWVPSLLTRARVIESPAFLLVDSGFACDTFNVVCRARFGTDADSRIPEVLRYFGESGRPFAWWVGPLDEPVQLRRALEDARLVVAATELGMVADLRRWPAPPCGPDRLRIVQATREQHVREFGYVVAANWDPPDGTVVSYYETAAGVVLGPGSPQRLYIGYVGDEPVATCEVCLAGGVAGLYGVATVASWRRRGFGAAMTSHAMREAAGGGVRVGVLQASDEGRALYAQLGFRPHGLYVEYQPRPN